MAYRAGATRTLPEVDAAAQTDSATGVSGRGTLLQVNRARVGARNHV